MLAPFPQNSLASHTIFYKDWSGTSLDQTGPLESARSSHRHQPRLTSPVLLPRLDRSDHSEPCLDAILGKIKSYPGHLAKTLHDFVPDKGPSGKEHSRACWHPNDFLQRLK